MGAWLSALARAGGEAAQKQAGRLAMAIGLWALGGIMVLVALGFATAGIYTAIRHELGPVPSLFIMAAIFIVLAIAVFLVARSSGARKTVPRQVVDDIPEVPLQGDEARLASIATVASAFAYGVVSGLMRRRRR